MRRLLVLVIVALAVSGCKPHRPVFVPPPLPGLEVLPSRTKAVHIFVVPDGLTKDAAAVEQFVIAQRATVNDVFIVGAEAMSFSYTDRRLHRILDAARLDWEAIPHVDTFENEQLQWQSDHEFEIGAIEKFNQPLVTSRPKRRTNPFSQTNPKPQRESWEFDRNPSAPANPFPRLATLTKTPIQAAAATGSDQRSIRSGIANLRQHGRGQLYRLPLTVIVDGKRREITPGLFVLACGTPKGSWCDRRQSLPSNLPNRTKVVRLVVMDGKIADDRALLQQFVIRESIAESDVLIVRGEPKSYIHGAGLIDHDEALTADDHSVVYVMEQELEQLQWESNTDFVISRIEKKPGPNSPDIPRKKVGDIDNLHGRTYNQNPKAPQNPFAGFQLPKELRRQFLSGVANLIDHRKPYLGQLYKLSFEMMIDGKRMTIDPDVYCDM